MRARIRTDGLIGGRVRFTLRSAFLLGTAAGLAPSAGFAQTVEDLGALSIEELSQLEVHSASKRAQPVREAPTSIYVLTNEDILDASGTSLPEVLRLAPNLMVQRVDARQYAVSARGFNGYEHANKLLVLIDGRSVYTPLHSGVFWELHSPLLEDLAQIEVISGPGGTLYGPNAVNGVVNITSKSAHDTLGGLVRATAGANERTAALRFGTSLGDSGAVRVYVNAFDREDMPAGPGPQIDDRYKGVQAGFRADFTGARDQFTLQGDLFRSDTGGLAGDGDRSHNLLARWTRSLGAASSFQLQAYYDDYRRKFILARDKLETFDAEAQLNVGAGRHNLVLGAGVRTTRDEFINNLNPFVLDPTSRRLWVLNVFAQDELSISNQLSVIAGFKAERSSFTGFELLPNLRLAWKPRGQMLLWAAVSRAVRTPSRIDRQLVFPGFLDPAPDFQSEKLVAIEAGYRGRFGSRTTASLSVFYNIYDDLRTTAFTPGSLIPFQLQNGLEGNSYGLEAWITHQAVSWWRIDIGISTLAEDFKLKAGRNDIANGASLGANPDYQLVARSHIELSSRLNLELEARAIDDLNRTNLDGYVEAGARLGWQATRNVELYVAGNNLLHRTHAESADGNRAQLIERSLFAGTRISF